MRKFIVSPLYVGASKNCQTLLWDLSLEIAFLLMVQVKKLMIPLFIGVRLNMNSTSLFFYLSATVVFMIQHVWSIAMQARNGFVMAVETRLAGKALDFVLKCNIWYRSLASQRVFCLLDLFGVYSVNLLQHGPTKWLDRRFYVYRMINSSNTNI